MTVYRHPVRVDQKIAFASALGAELQPVADAPRGTYILSFRPITFIHAYALLGSNPQRLGADLRLYLATVISFFSSHESSEDSHVSLEAITVTDARRRLSEDLGVALASLFMVSAFGVSWDTITQIPANRKLSKKRPDFEAFDAAEKRYLFEAKGTTVLSRMESALDKAIGQVKTYPEGAREKLAIVSYLAADARLFQSHTFVVDPPTLPDSFPPTTEVARLLHGEKLFQFAGFPRTAAEYVKALAIYLRQEAQQTSRFAPRDGELQSIFEEERQSEQHRVFEYRGRGFIGMQVAHATSGASMLFGVAREKLDQLLQLSTSEDRTEREPAAEENRASLFDDGSIILIEGGS